MLICMPSTQEVTGFLNLVIVFFIVRHSRRKEEKMEKKVRVEMCPYSGTMCQFNVPGCPGPREHESSAREVIVGVSNNPDGKWDPSHFEKRICCH